MTAADLGTHQGLVRCGQCREVFNASWNLVDVLPDEASAAEESPAEETTAEEPLLQPGGVADIDTEEGPALPPVNNEAPEITLDLEPDATIDPVDIEIEPTVEMGPASLDVEPEPDAEIDPTGLDIEAELDTTLESDGVDIELVPDAAIDTDDADNEPEAESTAADTSAAPDHPVLNTAVALDPEATIPPDQPATVEPANDAKKPPQVAPATPQASAKIPDARQVTEEIVIEAPSVLWNIEDEIKAAEAESGDGKNAATAADQPGDTAPTPGKTPRRKTRAPERRSLSATRTATDVKLVEIPYPRPMKTAAWALGAVLVLLGIVWQVREYYLTDLAETPWMRAPLETFCEFVSCTVPPRVDIKSIDLVSTSVDPHPVTPGALRVSASLVNRANFEQQFPPLEVTLTDNEGNTVGRRTYLPHEYRAGTAGNMKPNVLEKVDLDLAQPAESAVGYEIQLVAR